MIDFTEADRAVMKKAVETYDALQIVKAMEEAAEFIAAYTKYSRIEPGPGYYKEGERREALRQLTEEAVDFLITANELFILFGLEMPTFENSGVNETRAFRRLVLKMYMNEICEAVSNFIQDAAKLIINGADEDPGKYRDEIIDRLPAVMERVKNVMEFADVYSEAEAVKEAKLARLEQNIEKTLEARKQAENAE